MSVPVPVPGLEATLYPAELAAQAARTPLQPRAASNADADAMTHATPDLLSLAEAPSRFDPLKPGEDILELPASVGGGFVFCGHGTDASSCGVEGIRRPAACDLATTVEHVRALVRERGRTGATWSILVPPHDAAILAELAALGLRPGSPPSATVMVRTDEPARGATDVEVVSVDTVEAFAEHATVKLGVFDALDRLPSELARIEKEGAADVADRRFVRYTARRDGVAVGAAAATFTPVGVMLHSGCVVEAERGRGVYTAMVWHRWNAAVQLGTPALVTRAGPMSRPILEKLGFTAIGEAWFLVDELALPVAGAVATGDRT